ncbi:PREDICTED: uncharacterized protein LOC106727822 isoform X2 [Myotis brandtii]|uniref:uncharacterized protein LOC106727822 isoform X2 n=1 Tax=Myotis brandtii TaxID=109478 RepID=UPI0007045198|nr:PREDICTED: uncharacterized protein LOC106727822 isoform X2 [Myotis brandtii]
MVPVSPPPPGSSVSWSLNRPGGIRRNPAAARRPTLPGRQCGGESRVPGGRAHVGLGKNIPTSSVSRTRCSPMRPTGRKECGRSPAHSETSTPRYLQARGPPASGGGLRIVEETEVTSEMEGLEFEPSSTFIESLHHFLLCRFCVKNQKQRSFCRTLWSPNSIVVFTSTLTKYGGSKEHSYCGFLTCRLEMNTDDMISPRSSWDSEAEEQAGEEESQA